MKDWRLVTTHSFEPAAAAAGLTASTVHPSLGEVVGSLEVGRPGTARHSPMEQATTKTMDMVTRRIWETSWTGTKTGPPRDSIMWEEGAMVWVSSSSSATTAFTTQHIHSTTLELARNRSHVPRRTQKTSTLVTNPRKWGSCAHLLVRIQKVSVENYLQTNWIRSSNLELIIKLLQAFLDIPVPTLPVMWRWWQTSLYKTLMTTGMNHHLNFDSNLFLKGLLLYLFFLFCASI